MTMGSDQPALFLGVADFLETSNTPFPLGAVDLFQLSQHKRHIIYPGFIQGLVWVVLIQTKILCELDQSRWALRVADESDSLLGKIEFKGLLKQRPDESQHMDSTQQTVVHVLKNSEFTMFHFKFDGLVNHPGRYTIYFEYKNQSAPIGFVHFSYSKAPTLTPDQIKAIESDPNSVKFIRFDLSCKLCPTQLKVYSGLSRLPDLEMEGCIWQTDLESEFACECGKTKYSLEYLKESMHGMLLKDFSKGITGLGYVRQYGHSQVSKIVTNFTELLNKERLEQPVQEFIENHPILLSRFHAKRLFVKPTILGRFTADFSLVDSQKQLWLIELEKPSLNLFKRDGHPSQALMHAYGQVTDWLDQYRKYSGAILDALKLKGEDVVTVRGAVIAGRSRDVTHEVLRRHLSNPPYQNVEFMTCDDLGVSLLEISRQMA
jgi:hypothetical protein